MSDIILSLDGLKLFVHVLDFFIKNQNQWFSDLDTVWSTQFGLLNQVTYLTFQNGHITEAERDAEFSETDFEMRAWEKRLGDWRFKRFYLNQYLNHLRQQFQEVRHEIAA